ncbi:MAG: helix-turn-helix domain-containing protein [bacterium]
MTKEIKTREPSDKNRFFLDNEFFDIYAKILGSNALAVYCSLCRHADREQKCYPSQKKIAEELKLSRATVNEQLKVLETFGIIKIQRIGKQCTNRYYLLDKKYWVKDIPATSEDLTSPDVKPAEVRSQPDLHQESTGLTSNSNKTQKKENPIETNIINAKSEINNLINLLPLEEEERKLAILERIGKEVKEILKTKQM